MNSVESNSRPPRHVPFFSPTISTSIFFFAIALLAISSTSRAQTSRTTGALRVTVLDESGGTVPGARVTIAREATSFSRTLSTGESGEAAFRSLEVGEYALQVDKDGFRTATVEELSISVGRTAVQQVLLRPAGITESVEVTAESGAVDTEATVSSAALGGERIEESPSTNRNYLNFVLVAPGVAASAGSNTQRTLAGIRSPQPDSGFSFGGMRGRNNSLSIDGVDNRDETTGGNRVSIGLEMVQEFRVAGAILGAEFGGAAGGAVNVVTRSGVNLWHGDMTWFMQHDRFNARNPEVESGRKQRFRRYQPGVSLLGPIRRDRTFFATAIEQQWESSEEWSDTPDGALETINRTLALPALSESGVHQAQSGLFPSKDAETEFSFKLNHQLNDKHSFSARHAYSRGKITADVQGIDNFTDRSARGSSLTDDHSFVAALISVPQPNIVNDLRVQGARRRVGLQPSSNGPMFLVPGVITLGQAYNLDADRTENHWEIVEGLSANYGRHTLSAGGSIHRVTLDSRTADRFGGVFIFPTLNDFTALRPDVFLQAFGDPRTRISTLPGSLWFQERWNARPGLTLEAGLRWDGQRLPAPFNSPTANFNPRMGIAWSPFRGHTSVLRAGFGLFYDRYPLAFLNQAIQKDGVTASEQYLVGPDAVAALSAGFGGPLEVPLAERPASTYAAGPSFPSTYSRKVTAGFEQGLGGDTKFTIEYAGVRGFHLPRMRNIAGALPPVYNLEQTARSSYQGVSFSINRRLRKELTYLVAYNVSRAHDDGSDFDEQPLDPLNPQADWSLSRQHQAQRIAASALFEIPIEDAEWAPEWLREAAEDFVVAPIFRAGSGRPINALLTTDEFRTGAFPISARPADIERNAFFDPATVNLDLRLMKGIWVMEHRAILQFGVEMFNLLNHSNPLRVSPYVASREGPLANFRGPVETMNARQLQLVVQFEY